jgi:hypothetical protein
MGQHHRGARHAPADPGHFLNSIPIGFATMALTIDRRRAEPYLLVLTMVTGLMAQRSFCTTSAVSRYVHRCGCHGELSMKAHNAMSGEHSRSIASQITSMPWNYSSRR